MEIGKCRAVVFDLDGLIVDTEPLQQRAFNQLLSDRGINYHISLKEYGRVFVGVSVKENAKWLQMKLGLKDSEEQIHAAHNAIYEQLIADPANLVPMPGLMLLLDHLRQCALPRVVATGSPRNHAEIVLRGLKIDSYFCAMVTGSDVAKPKPDPEIYLRAIAVLRVEPREAIALEDSAAGIAAAKAAGLFAIAVPNRYTAHQDVSHADARVENLGEIVRLVE